MYKCYQTREWTWQRKFDKDINNNWSNNTTWFALIKSSDNDEKYKHAVENSEFMIE